MLRSAKHHHIGGLIRAFKVTSAVSPTVDVGAGDAPTIAVASTSTLTLTPYRKLIRPGIVLCQAATNIADGGYGIYSSDPSATAIVCRTLGASGSADAGTSFVLALDYSNEFTDRTNPAQSLKNTARSPRLMAFRISAAGAVTIGGTQGTCSVASSVYTITFNRAFGRACMAWVTPVAATQKAARVTSVSASSVTIALFDSSEAAEDNIFDVVVLGWDSDNEQWGMGQSVQVPQLKPRIEAFRVDGVGTANIALGSTDATLVDNGTGDFSLTWTKAFARAPIVVVTGKAGRAQLLSAATTTAVNVGCFDASGVAADDEFCALVVGFDSAMEI